MYPNRPRALPRLILASGSPQRRRLLDEAGYRFEVVVPDGAAEDDILPNESPSELVQRLARQKAADVRRQLVARMVEADYILGCDTVAEFRGEVLGKPRDARDARRMLELLRGELHRVHSGLCLWPLADGEPWVELATTTLRMERLDAEALNEYLASGLWQGKAGAFGYQDRMGWLSIVEGSESNVIGLPLELLAQMLAAR